MLIGKGQTLAPESIQICVLYDPSDGRIVHTHKVVTYPGGKTVNEKQVEARAMELVAKTGVDTSKLRALQVPPEDYSPTAAYQVDTKSMRLVARTIPPRK
jgi:hypothetical protein